jgi:acyl-CoA thioesterase
MATGDLEHALKLSRSAEGIWTAHADPNYEAANGMFGGWTTAVALRAVCEDADGDATPCAITINFVSQIEPGADILIRTRREGGGQSVSYWRSEITTREDDITLATASVVLAARRPTDGHLEIKMPEAPDPATLEVTYPAPGPFGQRAPIRPIVGNPSQDKATTYSTGWVRETSGRTVDHLQLAFLADHRAPRSFFWSDGPRPSATLTLSVYFHATHEELAAVGDDDVLSEAFGTRGAQSTSEEHLRLWSRQGALLATSVQMDWYR